MPTTKRKQIAGTERTLQDHQGDDKQRLKDIVPRSKLKTGNAVLRMSGTEEIVEIPNTLLTSDQWQRVDQKHDQKRRFA